MKTKEELKQMTKEERTALENKEGRYAFYAEWGLLEKFGYWWWMFKIRWYLQHSSISNKISCKLFCNHGFHKVRTGSIETINAKGEKLKTSYVKCYICESHFFPTSQDKENYLRIKDKEKSVMSSVLKMAIKSKRRVKEFV